MVTREENELLTRLEGDAPMVPFEGEWWEDGARDERVRSQ